MRRSTPCVSSAASKPPTKRGRAVGSRWLRTSLMALVAIVAATTGSIARPADPAEAGGPYRIRQYKLADICPNGLPWTSAAPLGFPARRPRDKHGVPMIIVNGKRYYRPGALAINGMKRLDTYAAKGDPRQLAQALKQARQLRKMTLMRRRAAWIPFQYDYPPAAQRAPWFNAMVQGLAISFYMRLYHVTGHRLHMRAANKVFRSFLRLGQGRKPWIAYADGSRNLWLEHYPLKRPDHVLNAHMHAIIGIYEYWQATRSPKARRVLNGAITTMRFNLHRYRRPGALSYYGLRIRSVHRKYHNVHVWQIRLLAKISGDPYFDRFYQELRSDSRPKGWVPGRPARQGPATAGPHCRPTTSSSQG